MVFQGERVKFQLQNSSAHVSEELILEPSAFGIGRNDAGFVLARKTCFGQLECMWNDTRTTIYSREPME
jgi:hypothetical protein